MSIAVSLAGLPADERESPADRLRRRAALARLDRCLNALEDESERGSRRVSTELARVVGALVPRVRPGMAMTQAMDVVLATQEGHMLRSGDRRSRRRRHPRPLALSTILDPTAAPTWIDRHGRPARSFTPVDASP